MVYVFYINLIKLVHENSKRQLFRDKVRANSDGTFGSEGKGLPYRKEASLDDS
jgi:hypothetical protein